MRNKFLKEVVAIIAGKQFEHIADLISSKDHINEFLIAKKLNLTINQTRNILYKISNDGLISSLRKKDKRKGWYTYYWRLDILKSLEFLKEYINKRILELKFNIKEREKKVYYYCNRCNLEASEEEALGTNFSCSECGNVYIIKDNTQFINELIKEINRLEEKIKLIDKEIDIERNILNEKKIRKLKKIEKEKQFLRMAKLKSLKKRIKNKPPKKINKNIKKKIQFKKKIKLIRKNSPKKKRK